MGPPDLKKMLTVKLKPRQDSYFDQFSRIIMVKVLMVTATITGISWLKDKVTCIVPKDHDTSKDFVSKACWINGMYVFRGLQPKQSSFYYGIPNDITKDGVNSYGVLCSTKSLTRNMVSTCEGLEKTFFLQYQWFPMGIIFLSFVFYLPYLLFKFGNTDLQAVKLLIKGKKQADVNYGELIKKYFNRKDRSRQNGRILLNIVVKVLYVIANVAGLLAIDSFLNGRFIGYGGSWMRWTDLPDILLNDYTVDRKPKAGHSLLPGFGLCQVRSEAQDIKTQYSNVHTYICELSQHVLYQYVLIILWFMLMIGIFVSIVGLLKHVLKLMWSDCFPSVDGYQLADFYSKLSIRERELMDYIRLKNIPVFGELMARMQDQYDTPTKSHQSHSSFDAENEKQPMIS